MVAIMLYENSYGFFILIAEGKDHADHFVIQSKSHCRSGTFHTDSIQNQYDRDHISAQLIDHYYLNPTQNIKLWMDLLT